MALTLGRDHDLLRAELESLCELTGRCLLDKVICLAELPAAGAGEHNFLWDKLSAHTLDVAALAPPLQAQLDALRAALPPELRDEFTAELRPELIPTALAGGRRYLERHLAHREASDAD